MADFSIFQKLKIIFSAIISTPLFLIASLLGLSLIILMIVSFIKKIKIPKFIYFIGWGLVIIFVGLKYSKIVPKLLDNLVDTIFKGLYFPSIGFYMFIIVITNISFIVLAVQKTVRKSYKIVSGVTSIIMNVLFIIVGGIMTKNKIDISDSVNMYTNSTLLVLLQISMALFLIYILIVLFIRIYIKMKILDSVKFGGNYEYPSMGPVIVEKKDTRMNEVIIRKVIKPHKENQNEEKTSPKKNDDFKVRKVIKK